MSNPSNKEGPLSSAANNELKDKQKRTNQVKVSLNSEELKNLDDLVIRMGSDRSSAFRHLLNLSSQNSLKNEDSRELQSDKETTRGDVLISAVVSSYLLTHLHHVLEKAEYGASKEGRSSHAANFAQLRKVLCSDSKSTKDASSLSSIHFSNSSDENDKTKRVVHFFKPKSFDEIPNAVQSIEEGSITILNLNLMEPDQSQRAVDFVAGAVYGLKGHQENIDEGIFVFAPSNTELISFFEEDLKVQNDLSNTSIPELLSSNEKLEGWFAQLNDSEQKIMRLIYGLDEEDPLSLSDIGRQMNVSDERVRELVENALSKLNKILTKEKTDIKDSQSTVEVETPDSGLDLTTSNQAILAAIDGACSGNPGPGGWGALIRFLDGKEVEFGGFNPETTNNRMEMQAALAVFKELKELPRSLNLVIKTDSKYLIDGLEKWMPNWKKKGWKTASGKPVLNQDLWKALDAARIEGVKFKYVEGHSGEIDNDRVDAIAVAFSKGRKIQLKELVTK